MNDRGLTLLEILIVIAIMGIIAAFGVNAIKNTQRGGEQNAFISGVELGFKNAASYASSRRTPVIFTRTGNTVAFVTVTGDSIEGDGGMVIPKSLTTNIPEGPSLVFTGGGGVSARTLPQPVIISGPDRRWNLYISAIGDTRTEETVP